jgi:hypothetical protein
MLRFFRIAAALLAALCVTTALMAQSSGTTGSLFGSVKDTEGKALPGVTVSITSPSLQGTRTSTTNVTGDYNFPLLPPGTYRVEAALSGFEPQIRDTVVVSLNKATKVNVAMSLSKVTETITVTGNTEVIDPTQANTQVNLKEDFLKYASVGQAGRSYQDAMEVIPGVADQVGAGGNPSVFGANLGQNAYLIDGLNTTDPVTHTFSVNFGFDAIQEINVQTGGFEAEYGRAVGGILNIITKSGGNNFSGTADVRYTSNKLTEQGTRKAAFPPGTDQLANDKNEQEFRTLNPEGSIGGPILRDKIWFFGDALRNMNRNQPFAVNDFEPAPDLRYGWDIFGKITAAPVTGHSLQFRYTNSYQDNRGAPNVVQAQQFISPEAAAEQYQKSEIYNVNYDAVLSSNWTANIQGGITNGYLITQPQSGDLTTTGSLDAATGILTTNFTNFQKSHRDRNQALASTTYFFEGLGSHAIKVGTDLEQTKFLTINNLTGTPPDPSFCSQTYFQPAGATCGAEFEPNNGAPFVLLVATALPEQKFKGNGMAFYAQDEWRPVPNLTMKLGARFDEQTFYNDVDTHVKTLNRIQPRIGVAYDLFNNSQTVLRAQGGEFMEDLGLTLPSYLSTTGAVTSEFVFSHSHQQYVFVGAFGGASGNLIDPALRAAYTREGNVGVTQRIFDNTSLDLAYVYREGRNMIEDSCVDQSSCPGVFWLTNMPNKDPNVLRADYHGAVLTIQSRLSSRASILASYTYSKSRGSLEYTQNAGADFDVFPVHFVDRYGYLSDDARSRVKIDGFYKFPWEITFGTHFYWDSGVPYNITLNNPDPAGYGVEFLVPRGSNRLPHFYQWDAQLQKDFQVGPVRLGVIGSVFNILDTEIAVARNGSVGTTGIANPDNPQFNFDTAYQRPRRFEVGLRLEF